jgi:hypothetical protein
MKETRAMKETLGMKESLGIQIRRGPQRLGARFMDSSGGWFSIECSHDGIISTSVQQALASKEQSETAAAQAILNALNDRGGDWGPAERLSGPEVGVDRIAYARTVTDRRRARPDQICKMQVTKGLKENLLWRALAISRSHDGYPFDAAVAAMKAALAGKESKPAGKRDNIILVLDAMEVLIDAIEPAIEAFRGRHGEWARSLGFQEIWVAGPFDWSFRLV